MLFFFLAGKRLIFKCFVEGKIKYVIFHAKCTSLSSTMILEFITRANVYFKSELRRMVVNERVSRSLRRAPEASSWRSVLICATGTLIENK